MQTKSIKMLFALSAVSALCLSVGEATANNQVFLPVSICQYEGTGFNIYGNAYIYGSNGSVVCGIGQDQALDTNDDVRVYFHDDSTGTLSCYGYEVDEDHSNIIYSGSRYGCATAGGCANSPDPSPGYAGSNYLTLADIRHGGGTYSTVLTCVVPGGGIGSPTPSEIKSIVLTEQ